MKKEQGLFKDWSDYVSTRNIIDEICKKLSIEPNEEVNTKTTDRFFAI